MDDQPTGKYSKTPHWKKDKGQEGEEEDISSYRVTNI